MFLNILILLKYLAAFLISILPLQALSILIITLLLSLHLAYRYKSISFYFEIFFY